MRLFTSLESSRLILSRAEQRYSRAVHDFRSAADIHDTLRYGRVLAASRAELEAARKFNTELAIALLG